MNSSNVSPSPGFADDGKDNSNIAVDLEGEAGQEAGKEDSSGLVILPPAPMVESEAEEPLDSQNYDYFISIKNLECKTNYLETDTAQSVVTWDDLAKSNTEAKIDPGVAEPLRLHQFTRDFIASLDPAMVDQLAASRDPDKIIQVLYPIFQNRFMKEIRKHLHWPTFKLSPLMHIVFGAVISALMKQTAKEYGMPHWLNLCRAFAAHEVEKSLRKEKELMSSVIKDYARTECQRRRDKFASPTRHIEDDPLLTVGEKVRVFMNALRERNDAGACIKWQRRDENRVVTEIGLRFRPLIIFKHQDRKVVEQVFLDYPHLTVQDLLRILDRCVQVGAEEEAGEADLRQEKFYPLKGCILSFFCAHLETIVEKLNIRYGTKLRL